MDPVISVEDSQVDLLHEIGVRLATADGFHEVLTRVVEFASALVKCDSCLIYVLEEEELVLRASKNPHPEVDVYKRQELGSVVHFARPHLLPSRGR